MNIHTFLDATYLKTAKQADISEQETVLRIKTLTKEAIAYNYKLIMIRAEYIRLVKEILDTAKSRTLIGTVIDFPEGNLTIDEKLKEAKKAIDLGVDELDFVINYNAFKQKNYSLVKEEVTKGTSFCLKNNKTIKWIIEIAALSDKEIIVISQLIKETVMNAFGEKSADRVFVKSSTGFYKTRNNKPNGASIKAMKLIIENAKPLKVKAAGGVKDYKMAAKMIHLGVDRIGTSSAKEIINKEKNINSTY